MSKSDHPAHDLYEAVSDTVAGVSAGCAVVFGATEEAEQAGLDLIKENPVPGTVGLPSLQKLMGEGYTERSLRNDGRIFWKLIRSGRS